jgi:SAM-dependent methyltransferase
MSFGQSGLPHASGHEMITGRQELRKAYQDDGVARDYIARRFETPIGELLHAQQLNAVRGVLANRELRRALEIAPGPARLTFDLAPHFASVTLVDASREMLAEARRRLARQELRTNVHLVQGDAFRLPVSGPFDLVYTFRLLRHFARTDRLAFYREVAAVLAPGGWLLFDAVNAQVAGPIRARAKPGELQHFDALLTADDLVAEVEESGFTVDRLVGVQKRMAALVWCQVYLAPRSPALARAAMQMIQRSGGDPLEWVVVCRRA